jgi:hypothetical protein
MHVYYFASTKRCLEDLPVQATVAAAHASPSRSPSSNHLFKPTTVSSTVARGRGFVTRESDKKTALCPGQSEHHGRSYSPDSNGDTQESVQRSKTCLGHLSGNAPTIAKEVNAKTVGAQDSATTTV